MAAHFDTYVLYQLVYYNGILGWYYSHRYIDRAALCTQYNMIFIQSCARCRSILIEDVLQNIIEIWIYGIFDNPSGFFSLLIRQKCMNIILHPTDRLNEWCQLAKITINLSCKKCPWNKKNMFKFKSLELDGK